MCHLSSLTSEMGLFIAILFSLDHHLLLGLDREGGSNREIILVNGFSD